MIDAHRRNESTDFGTLNSILAAEIMVVEGAALSDAGRQAWDQISGEGRDQTLRWANERIAGYRASRSRSWFENYRAEDLVHSWAAQKGLPDETAEDVERLLAEMRELVERPPDDPELAELVEYAPGTLEEIREVLHRRRGDG